MTSKDHNTTLDSTDQTDASNHEEHMTETPNRAARRRRKPYVQRKRPVRRKYALNLLLEGLQEDEDWKDATPDARLKEANARLDEATKHNPKLLQQLGDLALNRRVPDRTTIELLAEKGAIMRLPQIAWVFEDLQLQEMGRPARRSFLAALFCEAAFGRQRPELKRLMEEFYRTDQRDFVYGELERSRRSATYSSLHAMFAEQPASVWRKANIDLIKELVKLSKESNEVDDLYAEAGRYLMIDGSQIQAHARQIAAEDGNGSAQDMIIRGKRSMAAFSFAKGPLRGYSLMLIADAVLGLPLVWKLYPSNVPERSVVVELLDRLWEMWPECPAEYLIADALYEDEEEFNSIIEHGVGLRPVFHRKKTERDYGKDVAWTHSHETMKGEFGVPHCACGIMKYRGTEDFLTRLERAALRDANGDPISPFDPIPPEARKARIRWVCPNSVCAPVECDPLDDARVYTFLPRAGNSKKATLRQALYLKRNGIESIFSDMKSSGIGSAKDMVARWADDHETEHLIGARLTYMTAKRLVHERGDYERVLQEGRELGLIDDETDERPRLDNLEHQRMLHARKAQITPIKPTTWYDRPWAERARAKRLRRAA